jgi:hypothetical protein
MFNQCCQSVGPVENTDFHLVSIPRIEEALDCLAGSTYFSRLDVRSAYLQCNLKEADRYKTAFNLGQLGFYECTRLSFGLTNACATFQRLMERCMGEINLRECFSSSVLMPSSETTNPKYLISFLQNSHLLPFNFKPFSLNFLNTDSNLSKGKNNGKRKGKTKPVKWNWGQEQQVARERLIEVLTSPPILTYADYSLPFLLDIDASGNGLGPIHM